MQPTYHDNPMTDKRPALRIIPLDAEREARASVRFDLLQLRETRNQDAVATTLADRVYGVELADLDRRERATCRFLATFALRGQKDYWIRAARKHAIERCAWALKAECGAATATISDEQATAMATVLVGNVLAAYHGLLDGSTHLPPGVYLQIVQGQR